MLRKVFQVGLPILHHRPLRRRRGGETSTSIPSLSNSRPLLARVVHSGSLFRRFWLLRLRASRDRPWGHVSLPRLLLVLGLEGDQRINVGLERGLVCLRLLQLADLLPLGRHGGEE